MGSRNAEELESAYVDCNDVQISLVSSTATLSA
jgi:hypothetical protein